MHLNLPRDLEAFVQAQVDAGRYTNASEVVRDAIRRMQEDTIDLADFDAAVARGDADLAAGRSREFTPAVMDEVIDRARNAVKRRRSKRDAEV